MKRRPVSTRLAPARTDPARIVSLFLSFFLVSIVPRVKLRETRTSRSIEAVAVTADGWPHQLQLPQLHIVTVIPALTFRRLFLSRFFSFFLSLSFSLRRYNLKRYCELRPWAVVDYKMVIVTGTGSKRIVLQLLLDGWEGQDGCCVFINKDNTTVKELLLLLLLYSVHSESIV